MEDGAGQEGGRRLLGIVASLRPGGNCELLTRLALATAVSAGATADILLLRDLRIDFCEGCLACVYGRGCPRPDDVGWLFAATTAYDGLILASPVLRSGLPAQVKTLVDRSVSLFPHLLARPALPTGTIYVDGSPPGDGSRDALGSFATAPVVNELALLLGGRLVGSVSARGIWPGEALLDGDTTRRVESLALAVLRGDSLTASPGECPGCGLKPEQSTGHPDGACPFCLRDPSQPAGEGRFTGASLTHHLLDWMLPSRDRFLNHRAEVRAAKARLGAFEPRVIRPR